MATELEKISRNTEETREISELQHQSLKHIRSNLTTAIDAQTFAVVASSQALARSFGTGFDNVNNTLGMGFLGISGQLDSVSNQLSGVSTQLGGVSGQLNGVSSQLGHMNAAFSAGLGRIADILQRISKDVCERLDEIRDIANNPRLTEARELYRSAVVSCNKSFYEEAIEDLKAALQKNKIDYISWFLLGEVYLFGKGKFCNVIDLDASIGALTSAAKYIDPEITASTEAMLMASEIYFYLGLAKYNKYKDLNLQGRQAEAKTILEDALQAFEEAYGFSQHMLEACYNVAKCKALAGNTSGALADLEAVMIKDRNYCLKVFADGDLDFFKNYSAQLIDQLKYRAFVKAEPKYSKINALVRKLETLGGFFSEPIPQFTESLPYFDMLDCNAEFGSMIPRIERLIQQQREQNRRREAERQEQERQKEQKRKVRERFQELKKYSGCISAGIHTVGLREDGTVVAVGDNESGQCNVKSWRDIVAVSAGYHHTVGLKADGTVIAVGRNLGRQCNIEGWHSIVVPSAGGAMVGLRADGTVVAIGYNTNGQCNIEGWHDIIAVSAGYHHTVGLKADGTVIAVGHNSDGQCNIEGWHDIIAVSAGYYHTVGLKADGTVIAVGGNSRVQCNIEGWHDIVAVSAGYYHTVGLKADGTVIATGGGSGQCNNWHGIVAVSAGTYHTVGLKADGTVVAVGDNRCGQCETGGWHGIGPVDEEKVEQRRIQDLEAQRRWEEEEKRHRQLRLHWQCRQRIKYLEQVPFGDNYEMLWYDNLKELVHLRREEQLRLEELERRNSLNLSSDEHIELKEIRQAVEERKAKEAKEQQEKKRQEEQSKRWAEQGLCRHCGRKINGFFIKKCIACGEPA